MDDLRWSLFYLRHYILQCRFAGEKGYKTTNVPNGRFFFSLSSCQQMLQKLPTYMYTNPVMFSLQDLFKVGRGIFPE